MVGFPKSGHILIFLFQLFTKGEKPVTEGHNCKKVSVKY